jgi:hypothetical protein
MKPGRWLFVSAVIAAGGLAACGGGSDSPAPAPAPVPAPPPPPPAVLPPLVTDVPMLISGPSPYTVDCTGVPGAGTPYTNAEVEPYVAVNPRDPGNIVAVWQQDRWANGSANGLMTATTTNGGTNWTLVSVPFSRCAGGTVANGGDYERATDPWVTISPDGIGFQMALSTVGASFTGGSANAMLVSRSTDGGRTWSNPATLIRDGATHFNDKNTITADPTDARYVYAVWDRLVATGGGPSTFARTTDGGLTWEGARSIYDPGTQSQTIGNVIAVLPNGTLVNLFAQLDTVGGTTVASLRAVRSFDKGATWGGAIRIADLLSIGARDPDVGTPIRDSALIPQIAVAPNGDLWVVWQDARFSGGLRDGVALSRSTDGGATWSPPVQINSAPNVQAFMPSIHVRADATIGISYYDLRSNTTDPATLPTELIFARSANGTTWQENRISQTFDLAIAPNARGLFLGDYQGLASANNVFVPVYVRTSAGDLTNRTDVYALLAGSLLSATASDLARAHRAIPVLTAEPDAQFRQRVHENIVRSMNRRITGWSERYLPAPR